MPRPADPRLKTRLLRACAQEFSRRGFDPVRIEEISARAGYSKAAFYLHFDSKEAAFSELVTEMLVGLGEIVLREEGSVADLQTALRLWRKKDEATLSYLWRHRQVARLMLEGGRSATFAPLVVEYFARGRERLVRFLRWGVRERFLARELDVELVATFISGGYDRVAREIVRSRRAPDFAAVVERVHRTVIDKILLTTDMTALRLAAGERRRGKGGRS
jgi:AcrR family transcriptional regulator